ncbi:hypothetical protein HYZ98_02870 [Candidatus Peregrinibacteria bacterium]|nr:hypothetical protein [Candidatus Peregrinibacteria bacterium]
MAISAFEDPEEEHRKNEKNPLSSLDCGRLKEIVLIEPLRGAEGHPVVMVDVPSAFFPILDEPRGLSPNPREDLEKLLRTWWNDPQNSASEKSISDCFAATPALYYYALEHFSDPEFSFSSEERDDLKRQLCLHAGCLSNFANEVDDKALDFYWYFLVRLLTIHDRVQSSPDSILKEEHLSLLEEQYARFLDRLHDAKRSGYIAIPSISGWLEERLLDLGKDYDHLKPLIVPLLKADAVEEAVKTVHAIQEKIWGRYAVLFFQEQEKSGGWEADTVLQQKIQETLVRIRLAMSPNIGNTAWKHPMEYIVDAAEGKRIVYIDQAYPLDPKEDEKMEDENTEGEDSLQRVDQVELELLSRMTSKDTVWIFADAQVRICPLYDALEEQGRSIRITEMIDLVESYVNGMDDRSSLQETLQIAEDNDPVVQDCLSYWEAIRRRRKKNTIFLLNGLLAAEKKEILRMIPAFDRTIILAQGDSAEVLLKNQILPDDMLIIHHQMAQGTYPEDHVCIPGCLGYTAYEFGSRDGWGDFESSAVSLKGNAQLMEAVLHKDLGDQRGEFVQTYAVPLEKKGEGKEWICQDVILFTKCDDDGDHESRFSPVHSGSYVPVGS